MKGAVYSANVCVREFEGAGNTVLEIHEEYLDFAHAKQVRHALKQLCRDQIERGRERLILDLADVFVIDSFGWATLISVRKAVLAVGAKVALVGLSPAIQRLLEMMQLDRIFDVHVDAEAAVFAMTHGQPGPGG